MEYYIKGPIRDGDGNLVAEITDFVLVELSDEQFEGGYISKIDGVKTYGRRYSHKDSEGNAIYEDTDIVISGSRIGIFWAEVRLAQMLLVGRGQYLCKVEFSPEFMSKVKLHGVAK